jgi:ribosomal protein S18
MQISLKFVNEQGRILPRRLLGGFIKYQRKVSVAEEGALKADLDLLMHVSGLPSLLDLGFTET